MSSRPPTTEPHVERPGPAEFRDPLIRREMAKAAVWFGMALAIAGAIFLAQPLLLIVGGAIFAVFLDGGIRLLGRWLPIPRGWRLLLVLVLGFGFLGWVGYFAGTTIAAQFEALRVVVAVQFGRLMDFASSLGLIPKGEVGQPRISVHGLGRAPDERRRYGDWRGDQCHRHDRDRHLPRRRAAALRSRRRLDVAAPTPRRLLPCRRPRWVHAASPPLRSAGRHGVRRRLHLGDAGDRGRAHGRRCLAWSPACSPSSRTSAQSLRAY